MICAIVLAAGRSRRMGTQKLLLPLGGQPLLRRIVDEVVRSPVDQVFVVAGRPGLLLRQALAGSRATLVINPARKSEMLSSVRCGLRALPANCSAVLVVLGDQPGLSAGLISRLLRAFRRSRRDIVVPAHQGRRGHPLLFAAHYRAEILRRYRGVGLRGLLQAHPQAVLEVPIRAAHVLEDMDEPADYRKVVDRLARRAALESAPWTAPM